MKVFADRVTALLALGVTVSVTAWSQPNFRSTPLSATCSDRRGFLQKTTAATLVGTAAVETIFVENADAASLKKTKKPLYEVPPDSLTGKVVVITGGSTGLGLESAKRLAVGGATIVVTTRTAAKGERALDEIKSYLREKSISNFDVHFLALDLDDLENVKSFPGRYEQLLGEKKMDVLMNNAGVAAIPSREVTKDGFERTFQSNHLGPFLLTALLFPYLNREGARVINVASVAHELVNSLDMDNLNGDKEYTMDGWQSYGRSKLENILFAQELQRRADSAGLDWFSAVALHPGVVGTDIWRNTYVGMNQNARRRLSLKGLASTLFYSSVLTTEEGANTQVWLAAFGEDDNISVKGKYFDEDRKLKMLADYAKDEEKARRLWNTSEQLLGTEFKICPAVPMFDCYS